MTGQADRLKELKSLELSHKRSAYNNFVAVSSGKGGTGKTFLSANIAYALSKLNNKILLIDMDLNFANLNFLFNKIPQKSINDSFAGRHLFKEVITSYNGNLDIVFGNPDYESSFEFDRGILSTLIKNLNSISDGYDLIIFDFPSGGNKYQFEFLSACSLNIFISTPEPTSVIDSYVMLKFLNKLQYRGKKLSVINKIRNDQEGMEAYNNLNTAANHFLNDAIELLGFISYDTLVSNSINNQELLLQFSPDSTAASEIFNISRGILEITQMANIPH